MMKSVVRENKWPPSVLEGLFFDTEDYHGLFFWYDDVIECGREIK